MRILVVEDNERNLKLFSVILHQMGHEILAVEDNERNLKLFSVILHQMGHEILTAGVRRGRCAAGLRGGS